MFGKVKYMKTILVNDAMIYFSNGFLQLTKFSSYYLLAKFLNNEVYGTFSIILLTSSYLNNSNIGTINSMKRQIPIFFGDKKLPSIIPNTIFHFNLLSTFFFSLGLSLYYKSVIDRFDLIYVLLNIIMSVCTSSLFYFQSYFISTRRFDVLKYFQFYQAGILLFTIFSFLIQKSLISFLIIFNTLNLLLILKYYFQYELAIKISVKILKNFIKDGFPIMVVGLVFLLFQSIDRIFLTYNNNLKVFSFYSFSWTVVNSLNLITNIGSEFMLSRAGYEYGKLNDLNELVKNLLRGNFKVILLAILASFIIWIFTDSIILHYLPHYKETIPIIKYLLIATLLQSLLLWINNLFYILSKQYILVWITSIFCVLFLGILYMNKVFDLISNDNQTIVKIYLFVNVLYAFVLYILYYRHIKINVFRVFNKVY